MGNLAPVRDDTEVITVTRNLPIHMTLEQYRDRSGRLLKLQEEEQALNDERLEINRRLGEIRGARAELIGEFAQGTLSVPVECEIQRDFLSKTVRIYRLDVEGEGSLIEERAMTQAELQGELDLEVPGDTDAEAEGEGEEPEPELADEASE